MYFEVTTPWFLDVHEVIDALKTNITRGLNSNEANRRSSIHGPNELPEQPGTPFFKLVAKQFEDLLVIILLVAALVSFILALFEDGKDQLTAFVEPVVILLILIANATVGVIQENNAENAINELKAYEAAFAVALRDGIETQIKAEDVVPGDILLLNVGDKISADCRIIAIQSSIFTVDQSILTGESDSVAKKTEKISKNDIIARSNSFRSSNVGINGVVESSVEDPVRFTDELVVNQDKTNMLFSGTLVTSGKAVAVVTATGIATAIGQIHSSISAQEDEKTPLKKQLDQFGETLSKLIGGVCVAVWLINIGHFNDPAHGGLIKGAIYYFKIAVALAVAAVPEGLPAVVTTCLALGTRQMAKEGAIVRSLPSVETLGCTTVICVDKTGTLTTNQMCIKRIVLFKKLDNHIKPINLKVGGNDYTPIGEIEVIGKNEAFKYASLLELGKCAALCNNSKLYYDRNEKSFARIGEPTEAALRSLVEKIGLSSDYKLANSEIIAGIQKGASDSQISLLGSKCSSYWKSIFKRITTLEFTRKRKSMSVVCIDKRNDQRILYVKGAPENIIHRSNRMMLDNGKIIELTPERKEFILGEINQLGENSYRCLGLAFGQAPEQNQSVFDMSNSDHFEAIEQKLTLIGCVGMLDPVRETAKLAVRQCNKAGIRVVVLTGDNHTTAKAVCKELGILPKETNDSFYFPESEMSSLVNFDKTLSGSEWACLSPQEKSDMASKVLLLSRVEPIHKYQVVEALKARGEVVAMTGDGVNDAPALKIANIGVAMGSGTAVSKEASDLILVNNNFATIVSAVKHGRSIFVNTKQFIRYLISSNIGEVCCIFFAAALGIPEALTPVQLLWVNFVTDGLPATALSFNKPESDCMLKPPRSSREGIVNNFTLIRYSIVGVYVGISVVISFLWWFMYFDDGPRLTWHQLTSFQHCNIPEQAAVLPFDCSIFDSGSAGRFRYPSTVALSVLVTIEMLNALNSLSETQSLFTVPPFSNLFLVFSIFLSMGLHVLVLYNAWLAEIFGVAPLSVGEWYAVLLFSFPVILIDEMIKVYARRNQRRGTKNLNFVKDFVMNTVRRKHADVMKYV